jgi:protein gp37
VRRFISYEPALERVKFDLTGIDWLIVGGESGPGARRFDVSWAVDAVEQCRAAGVAPFVKQLGARPVFGPERVTLRDRKGGDWTEWPAMVPRVREVPTPARPEGT